MLGMRRSFVQMFFTQPGIIKFEVIVLVTGIVVFPFSAVTCYYCGTGPASAKD